MNVDTGQVISGEEYEALKLRDYAAAERYMALDAGTEIGRAASKHAGQTMFGHSDPAIRLAAFAAAREHKARLRSIAKASKRRNRH